ncbi:MAG: sulfite reductase subunit A, partial [Burkholderiales bacterium]
MAGQERWLLERSDLQRLLDALRAAGYRTIGPVARDGAIVYDAIDSVEELPAGWTDRQDGGSYRLERRDDQALFGYAVG